MDKRPPGLYLPMPSLILQLTHHLTLTPPKVIHRVLFRVFDFPLGAFF